MKERTMQMLSAVAGWLPDTLMTAGAGGVAYGAWMVYEPAGFVVGGGFALLAGWLLSPKGGR